MTAYPKVLAAVLTASGTHYSDGRHHPLAPHLNINDLPVVLAGGGRLFGAGNEGVIMLGTDVDSLQDTITRKHPVGWTFTELRPWTTFRHAKTGTTIHVGALGDDRLKGAPLFDRETAPLELAARLAEYHRVTGAPFHATPGVSGLGALRSRLADPGPGRQPYWRAGLPTGALRGAGPLVWHRDPGADAAGHVHVFDINGMYLAAMKNAAVAWGQLQPTGPCAFDPEWAGYWQIAVQDLPAELYDGREQPPVFPAPRGTALVAGIPGGVRISHVWVTTPVMVYLSELGVHPEVLDSWTCENAAPVFRPYAEQLIKARRGQLGELAPSVEASIKATYTQMVGLLGREGGRVHRPDWQHTIMDLARVNLLRRLRRARSQVGLWPHAVRTDAAYFVWPDQEPGALATALGVGDGIGMFKFADTLTVAETRAKFVAGVRV